MTAMTDTIRVLIIQPDDTHEVREIGHDLRSWQGIVGGLVERVSTPHCDLWFNEEGIRDECPVNQMATYLWWKLSPEMEGVDVIRGPVFVTGHDDGAGYSTPISDEVINLYTQMEQIRREEEGGPT